MGRLMQRGWRCGGLSAAMGAWIATGAPGCRPSVPAQIRYRVLLSDGDAVRGVAVTRQGATVGTLSAAGDVEFAMPSSVRPSALGLALSLPTPCGTRSVPLELQLTPDADSDRRIAEVMARERVVLLRGRLAAGAGGRPRWCSSTAAPTPARCASARR